MKPYYAKYLPVEGEIKPGDHFTSNDGPVLQNTSAITAVQLPGLIFRKMKLFLCENDVQPGDTLIDRDGIKYVISKRQSELYKSGGAHLATKLSKVIGEISPTCDWVKEGDQFDESQFTVLDICPNYNGAHLWKDCSCKSGFVEGVVIRRPK